jgi:hypothetical protein
MRTGKQRRLIVPEQTVLIQLAPQKDLVGIDVVLARHTRYRRAGRKRRFDHGALERDRMTLVGAALVRASRSGICVHDLLCGHNIEVPECGR